MVEFIRDVVIVVAVLLTVFAVALGPATDSDASRPGEPRAHRISVPAPATEPTEALATKAAHPGPK
jgi:hypothetical protein